MRPRLLGQAILALASFGAFVYLLRFVLPAGTLDGIASEGLLLETGTVVRFASLVVAAVFAFASARRLGRGPSQLPWTALAIGLSGFALGQGVLAFYQLRTGETPFPSLADVFFLGGYPFVLAAFALAIRAYHGSGMPIGSPRGHALVGLGALSAVLLVGSSVLEPIMAAPAPPLVRALNIAYPVLDLVALVPVLVLIRIAARFAGGQVAAVWGWLLTGFAFLSCADVAFAYFQVLGHSALDPLLYAAFLLAYGFIARGTVLEYEILTH